MADATKTAEDAIYNDDTNNYGYDQYQTENQWLYNDSQALQMPQAEDATGTVGNSEFNEENTNFGSKDAGKLFVGGLSWETDEMKLREYFNKYGNIIDCSIMRDQNTGRPRGFGFVTFEDVSGVDAVLKEPSHTLDGKVIDPKHAIPREQQPSQSNNSGGHGTSGNDAFADPVNEMKGDKVFVGGLPPSATDADLNSSFSTFGNIVETKLMIDRETGRSRGYGFLQFDNETSALEAVKAGNSESGISIHGKRVDVKPAVHRKRAQMPNNMAMMSGQGAYGMMGMPGYNMMGMNNGYGMMGMSGYGMMGMPGYNMAGVQNSAVDYSAMGYAGYYGNMGGYYGAPGAEGMQNQAGDPSAGANSYYTQGGAAGYYVGDGDGEGNNGTNQSSMGGNMPVSENDKGGHGSGAKNNDMSNSYEQGGYGNSSNGNNANSSYNRGTRRSDDKDGGDRSSARDSSHRSSSRRHGGGDRSGRDRSSRGDRSSTNRTSRDDYRSSRGSRTSHGRDRDRDGPVRGSSSRNHGYHPY